MEQLTVGADKPATNLDYHALNAMLNLYDENRQIQFDKDKEAARQFFLQHVNKKTMFFHDLEEKLRYLVENEYYEEEFLSKYEFSFIKGLYKRAYSKKFRFPTFMGAYKYYTSYTLKTFDGENYLERYEDRVVATALYLADGDTKQAQHLVDEIMGGRFQPATPTFLNAGKKSRGELVSCFLLDTGDSMESISRVHNAALQLSKRGGGVAINLSNLREAGAPIKKIENQSSGVIPVMKMLEDAFSYANQLGARQGAGAVYLSAHHPDIMEFLDTRRENADEKIRIKTLSLGVVIPNITFELARNNDYMYMFSPYDVERVYGKPFSYLNISEHYHEMVNNPQIRKKKMKAREFFQTIAEVQIQSGYPYILFEDNANKQNAVAGKIIMSNLCSEILQPSEPSEYNVDLSYAHVGKDISCNLGSMNIARVMDSKKIAQTVRTAVRALTHVSETSDIASVPSIDRGNKISHAIGLGQMNLHGYLASNRIMYGSEEALDFTNMYFYTVAYHAVKASNELAIEKGESFYRFEESKYADGTYFDKYIEKEWKPATERVKELFSGIHIPTQADWRELRESVKKYGMYNSHLQAVAPTGSISYVNHSTASIHPIVDKVEARKEGKIGRVYYPAYGLDNDNVEFYQDAYEIGNKAIIDTYAAATQHVDQGLSCTLFFKEGSTTRDLTKMQMYAFKKGLKTLYYSRFKQGAIAGTDMSDCVSCAI